VVVARSIKTKIIKKEDNLVDVVVNSVLEDMKENNYSLNDKDVIGLTESIVSITNNNFCHINDIVVDLNEKFKEDDIGVVFPILSRNRFSVILKAIARAKKDVTILLSYPSDEVGNAILDEDILNNLKLEKDFFLEDFYYKHFKNFIHPWTKINMVDYYKKIVNNEGSSVRFIFSNNPLNILKYTKNILISDIHTRFKTYDKFKNSDVTIFKLDELLNKSINGSGYNTKYGLLGSNLATKDSLKLFPNENNNLLESIQNEFFKQTNKKIEVFIYGDGAFKDPVSKIWELADPVVSPSYTKGLIGSPNEVKLKYLAENEFKHLKGEELELAIKNYKDKTNLDSSLGTTPRRYIDLLGSLADLMSGSGDRSTPVVLIQNYFR